MTSIIVLSIIIFLFLLWAVSVYNSLVKMRNQVDEGWSGIDVQLKRRHSLIPNLVATVKGYQAHESNVFAEVTELRAKAMSATDVKEKAAAESALGLGLMHLFAVAEQYPQLKASDNFLDLSKNLSEIEDEIQMARRYYNGTVREYNTKIQSFPNNMLAGFFNFNAREFFEIENDAERTLPEVKFQLCVG